MWKKSTDVSLCVRAHIFAVDSTKSRRHAQSEVFVLDLQSMKWQVTVLDPPIDESEAPVPAGRINAQLVSVALLRMGVCACSLRAIAAHRW
jgi:hypothetical protein